MRYVHLPLNEEIRSVGGYYKLLEEGVLDLEGRKVLYLLKAAHVDTSCCGSGGLGFISIPGFVLSWKQEQNEEGLHVSEVKRVRTGAEQRAIRGLLKQKYPYISVVDFE